MYLNDGNQIEENDKKGLPRAVKLKRLKQMYELLIHMGLILIHNLYYTDSEKLEEGIMTIEECIYIAEPIILDLKNKFEDIINKELLLTKDELYALNGSNR
jgi:hypothetical protein